MALQPEPVVKKGMADKSDNSFDLIVVGGGPGGYVAAIRAAQLGLRTALVEREHLGGICLNWGCIPTKALLRTSEIYHLMQHAGDFGLSADNVSFDIGKVVKRSRKVAGRLNAGVRHLMKKNKVAVFDGHGRLAGKGKVAVVKDGKETATLSSPQIILATGARARTLPGLEPDGKDIWTYKEAMVPEAFPKSLLIVGSGAIGIEFASFYRTLGAEVTVVEMLDRILPVEDAEISAFVRNAEISAFVRTAVEKQGMTVLTGATVAGLDKGKDGITVAVESGGSTRALPLRRQRQETITVEKVILAIGITGNVEDLGLEDTSVNVDRGHIAIGPWGETGEPGVKCALRLPVERRGSAVSGPSATSPARPGWPTRRATRASSASRRSRASRMSTRSIRAASPAAPTAIRRSPASA